MGWDHAKIRAYYLWNHRISEGSPGNQPLETAKLAAAIQVLDHIVEQLGTLGMERYPAIQGRYF